MARRSIRSSVSIPPELRAKMDAIEDPPNWSAIACRAFEEAIVRKTKNTSRMATDAGLANHLIAILKNYKKYGLPTPKDLSRD